MPSSTKQAAEKLAPMHLRVSCAKGHDFSRADKANRIGRALAPAAWLFVLSVKNCELDSTIAWRKLLGKYFMGGIKHLL
jgi:hypothetical protein